MNIKNKTLFALILFYIISCSVYAACSEKNICLNSAFTDIIQFDDNTPCLTCRCNYYVHVVTTGQSFSGDMQKYDDRTAIYYVNITDDRYDVNDVLYLYYSCFLLENNLNASSCVRISVKDCSTASLSSSSNNFLSTSTSSSSSSGGFFNSVIDSITKLLNTNLNILPDVNISPVISVFKSFFEILNIFLNTFLSIFSLTLNIFVYFFTNPYDFYKDLYGYIWNFMITFVLANALIFLFFESYVMAYTAYKYTVYRLSFLDFFKTYIEIHIYTFDFLYRNTISLFNFLFRLGNLINLTIKLFVDAVLVIIDILIPLP